MQEVKEQVMKLLESLYMPKLIEYLTINGYFTCPASTRYHGSHEGGLMQHSLNVYKAMKEMSEEFKIALSNRDMIITALLHDVCKLGAYIPNGNIYTWNREQPKGHAQLSLIRIKQSMELTPLQETMIRFHMGSYGAISNCGYINEYSLDKLHVAFKDPRVKLMYLADEHATQGGC